MSLKRRILVALASGAKPRAGLAPDANAGTLSNALSELIQRGLVTRVYALTDDGWRELRAPTGRRKTPAQLRSEQRIQTLKKWRSAGR